jgi:hypothetical protein
MSDNPEFNGSVALETRIEEVAPAPPEPAVTHELTVPIGPTPSAAESLESQPAAATTRKARPRWVVPASIAAVALLASGTLGYFLYATSVQRDTARHLLAATQATLATTKAQLSAAQADAAVKKETADYVSLFVANDGAVQTDYENIIACNTYSECRTAAQQLLTDLQAFQQARSSAQVPAPLSTTDGMLGDSLSAGIAGTQEFITGMDNNDTAKIKDGGSKVDAAMLNMAKTQTALGTGLR